MTRSSRLLTSQRAIYGLLAAFLVLGSIYSVVTPLFEASDELWHYPMVKTLADGNGLPVQDAANPGPWRQEGSQPPLYYAIGALATAWIDTSDVDEIRRVNPHADNGIITEDGNNNMVVHRTARESWPWSGTVLAVHIVRLLSVLMGAGTVYFTYRTGEELFPHRRWLALAGAAAVAFTPMFLFISGSINNDNLGVLLSTIAIWLMLRMTRQSQSGQPTLRWSLGLGICLGLAALTKQSTLGLFALAGLTLAHASWKRRSLRPLLTEGALIAAIVMVTAGWWYYRNWTLYGDPTGLNRFLDIAGRRSPPASLLQLWGERVGFVQSYWGLFGGVSVPMSEWAYRVLNIMAALSLIGLVVFVIQELRHRPLDDSRWPLFVLTLLWIPFVVLPLVFGWTRYTLASQGRLIFSAIGSLSLWFMAGLSAWLPERWGKVTATGATLIMGVVAVMAPFVWIGPHYQVKAIEMTPQVSTNLVFTPPGESTPAMKLTGYSIQETTAHPGDTVHVTLFWESLAPMNRDWSVFVHLQDSADLIQAQRDTYPGLGLIATSDLDSGRQWADKYAISLSSSAYSPETLRVIAGLYDLRTGQRMYLANGTDTATLGEIGLQPSANPDGLPNPVSHNFGDQLKLVGYEITERRVRPGATVHLTLYWRALHSMPEDYTLSVQIFDTGGEKRGQVDQPLARAGKTTRQWVTDEIASNEWSVVLSPETQPGTATLQLIIYWVDGTGTLQRLQMVTPDGRLSDPFLTLAKIQVAP